MDSGLKNKVALVTGSSRGIGKAVAAAFLEEGAKVIITGRDNASLNGTFNSLAKKYNQDSIMAYRGDMTQADAILECVDKSLNKFKKIDALIANVGTGKAKTGLAADRAEWERMLNLNLMGGMEAVRAVVPVMQKERSGNIVFVSSIAGMERSASPLPYAAAKAALIALAKNLSGLLARDNIRVNTVAPGNIMFKGGRWEEIRKEKPDTVENYIRTNVPMQRFGKPEEIADAVVYLASERASFITGTCLAVDGGQTQAFQ